MSMMGLLKEKRFGPFFLTQFLGAFNDNLYKNALLLLFAFKVSSEMAGVMANLAAGLFILPFFLFSPLAGQIADRHEKSALIRRIKIIEIFIMLLGAVAFFAESTEFLLGILFLMGAQSAFFGPVKFSIIPQHLKEEEMISGNGLVEMGTFLAILLGTILGGILIVNLPAAVGPMAVLVSLGGFLISRGIPEAPATDPELKISYNPIETCKELWVVGKKKDSVFLSILGISWFWFIGSIILVQIPGLTRNALHADESVVTVIISVFSIAVGIGSFLCEKFSQKEIEIGLVPLGAIGLTIFLFDIFLISFPMPNEVLTWSGFLWEQGDSSYIRLIFDVVMIGIFGSIYVVPLNTLIQDRSEERYRSRVIAGCNIMNAFFMVAAAGFGMLLGSVGWDEPGIFMVLSLMNAAVAIYIFLLVPEFVLRFGFWILAVTIYRLRFENRDKIPRNGAALLVANHISFIDWFIITATCKRPVRFVMYHKIFNIPILKTIFRLGKTIPIAPRKENEETLNRAMDSISEALREGELVCIFPEGQITFDGEVGIFKPGAEKILAKDPVPLIPIGLGGLWGSFFSRKKGRAMAGLPRPSMRKISVVVGEPMSPQSSAEDMRNAVLTLVNVEG